nr:hypothetical protein [Pseudomonas sp. BIGb0427]
MARLSGKDKQAETVLTQVKDTLRDSLLFYVRHVAAREAAQLLRAVRVAGPQRSRSTTAAVQYGTASLAACRTDAMRLTSCCAGSKPISARSTPASRKNTPP